MHVLLVIVGGFLLLAVFALFGRLWSTSSPQMPTALLAFIGTWLLVSVANMWVGVSRAGYTARGVADPVAGVCRADAGGRCHLLAAGPLNRGSVMPATPRLPALRRRDGHHARVTYEELFFDLVYVFAVTQLSHHLLHHLGLLGVLQTLVLWFAVWLGWQYACWVSNWFDPEAPRIRGLLFVTMLLALLMSSSIPEAFAGRAWMFAGAYATMQVGRTLFVLLEVGRSHPLAANFRRMLAWVSVSACFWLAGAAAEGHLRLALWAMAAACEYISPMFGFAFPGLGRSRTREWTIEGGHLAERCQLFVIVALGETLLATGGVLSEVERWSGAVVSAVLATFAGTIAMWWLYFGISSRDATDTITRSDDPGRIGAYFHYVHALLIAGIIATAVGNDLVMD
ncbi:low temperature requirement protein A, partial [Stutzerimonas nitrititolerans]|uniref:low temperature requirement protein A n=1 Tax=Stutzerimonas nitrititolerans TaxID=2482751 RepID=UPI0028A902A1